MTVEIYRYNHHSRSLAIHGDHLPACLKLNVPDLLAYWNELFPMVVFRKKVHTWNQKYRPDLPALQNFVSYKKVSKINLLKKIFPIYGGVQKYSFVDPMFFLFRDPEKSIKIPRSLVVRWSFRWFNSSPHRGEELTWMNWRCQWNGCLFKGAMIYNQCLILEKTYMQFFWFHVGREDQTRYWTYIVHIISML